LEIDQIEQRTFPISRRGYDRGDVDAFLKRIAAQYRDAIQAAQDAVENAAAAEAAASSNSHTFDNVGSHVSSILATASQAAENLRLEAEQEADSIRGVAEQDAAELKRVAEAYYVQAEGFKLKAEQEATALLSRAKSHVESMLADAREEASGIVDDSRAEVARFERVTRAKVETIVAEARRDYEHMRALQQQCTDRLSSVEFLIQQAKNGLSGQLRDPGESFEVLAESEGVSSSSRRLKFRRND